MRWLTDPSPPPPPRPFPIIRSQAIIQIRSIPFSSDVPYYIFKEKLVCGLRKGHKHLWPFPSRATMPSWAETGSLTPTLRPSTHTHTHTEHGIQRLHRSPVTLLRHVYAHWRLLIPNHRSVKSLRFGADWWRSGASGQRAHSWSH